jgi:hypothetical protein
VNIDVQELVADELRRRASGVTWQPALLDRALERHRRRQLRRRAAVGAGTFSLAVSVLAVVVFSATSGSRAASPRPSVQTVAYVVSRARSAVATADAEILEVHSRLSNGWSYTAWLGPAAGEIRIDTYPPAGRPVRYYSTNSRAFMINFETRTYSSQPVVGHGLGQPPGVILFSLFGVSATWGDLGGSIPSGAAIRHQLATGAFRLIGRETVYGERLLHLTGVGKLPELRPAGGGYRALDMWINPSTFLPVRSVTGEGPYAPRIESMFTWLAATRQRAIFVPEVPAGFKDVSDFLPGLAAPQPSTSPTSAAPSSGSPTAASPSSGSPSSGSPTASP